MQDYPFSFLHVRKNTDKLVFPADPAKDADLRYKLVEFADNVSTTTWLRLPTIIESDIICEICERTLLNVLVGNFKLTLTFSITA